MYSSDTEACTSCVKAKSEDCSPAERKRNTVSTNDGVLRRSASRQPPIDTVVHLGSLLRKRRRSESLESDAEDAHDELEAINDSASNSRDSRPLKLDTIMEIDGDEDSIECKISAVAQLMTKDHSSKSNNFVEYYAKISFLVEFYEPPLHEDNWQPGSDEESEGEHFSEEDYSDNSDNDSEPEPIIVKKNLGRPLATSTPAAAVKRRPGRPITQAKKPTRARQTSQMKITTQDVYDPETVGML